MDMVFVIPQMLDALVTKDIQDYRVNQRAAHMAPRGLMNPLGALRPTLRLSAAIWVFAITQVDDVFVMWVTSVLHVNIVTVLIGMLSLDLHAMVTVGV